MKFIEPERDELGRFRMDSSLAESYSKLNLALSVMHECFESLRKTLSSRDMVEDVIFGRRSDIGILEDRIIIFYVALCICVIHIYSIY